MAGTVADSLVIIGNEETEEAYTYDIPDIASATVGETFITLRGNTGKVFVQCKGECFLKWSAADPVAVINTGGTPGTDWHLRIEAETGASVHGKPAFIKFPPGGIRLQIGGASGSATLTEVR